MFTHTNSLKSESDADESEPMNPGSGLRFCDSETRAYFVSAFIAQGRGDAEYNPGGVTIWKSGWAQADKAAIERLLKTSKDYKDKLTDRIIPKPK